MPIHLNQHVPLVSRNLKSPGMYALSALASIIIIIIIIIKGRPALIDGEMHHI